MKKQKLSNRPYLSQKFIQTTLIPRKFVFKLVFPQALWRVFLWQLSAPVMSWVSTQGSPLRFNSRVTFEFSLYSQKTHGSEFWSMEMEKAHRQTQWWPLRWNSTQLITRADNCHTGCRNRQLDISYNYKADQKKLR